MKLVKSRAFKSTCSEKVACLILFASAVLNFRAQIFSPGSCKQQTINFSICKSKLKQFTAAWPEDVGKLPALDISREFVALQFSAGFVSHVRFRAQFSGGTRLLKVSKKNTQLAGSCEGSSYFFILILDTQEDQHELSLLTLYFFHLFVPRTGGSRGIGLALVQATVFSWKRCPKWHASFTCVFWSKLQAILKGKSFSRVVAAARTDSEPLQAEATDATVLKIWNPAFFLA